jgi:hypothetical protein
MTYNLQTSQLLKNRQGSTCALLKRANGDKLVAIAGGPFPGIEVWNPANGSVTTLNSTFPLADGSSYSKMIAVNGNTELIFYESLESAAAPKGIWKFSLANNAWTKIGEMLMGRSRFSALPVDGFTCP